MLAILKREFKSYFTTPIGYIFLAAFNFFLGFYFATVYSYSAPDIVMVIMAMSFICIFAVPILTMRIMSDDKRQKVDQVLLTAPVKLTSIVLGKFFAALAVFALGFAVTVIYEIIFAVVASINILPYIYVLVGTMLFGGALIAIGMFISSLTESAAVSAILTIVVNLVVLNISDFVANITAPTGDDWFSKALTWIFEGVKTFANEIAFINVYDSFGENLFSVVDIVYFLSIIGFFLFLCVRSLEKRRWA